MCSSSYFTHKNLHANQRRLDSGLQSIMVNERLITRGFSLMRWLSRREHLQEKQDGAFEGVGLRIIRQNSLKTHIVACDPHYNFSLIKFGG